jgi:hypothetical protein
MYPPEDLHDDDESNTTYTDEWGDHIEREDGTSTIIFSGPSGGRVDYDEFGEEC